MMKANTVTFCLAAVVILSCLINVSQAVIYIRIFHLSQVTPGTLTVNITISDNNANRTNNNTYITPGLNYGDNFASANLSFTNGQVVYINLTIPDNPNFVYYQRYNLTDNRYYFFSLIQIGASVGTDLTLWASVALDAGLQQQAGLVYNGQYYSNQGITDPLTIVVGQDGNNQIQNCTLATDLPIGSAQLFSYLPSGPLNMYITRQDDEFFDIPINNDAGYLVYVIYTQQNGTLAVQVSGAQGYAAPLIPNKARTCAYLLPTSFGALASTAVVPSTTRGGSTTATTQGGTTGNSNSAALSTSSYSFIALAVALIAALW